MVRLDITCFEDYNYEWQVASTLLQLDIPSKLVRLLARLEMTKLSLWLLLAPRLAATTQYTRNQFSSSYG